MKLRQAQRADLKAVLECFKELNQEGVTFFSKKRVRQLLRDMCIAVAVVDGHIAGACALKYRYDDTLEIFALATLSEYQGQGVGSRLVKLSEVLARSIGKEIVYAHSYAFYKASPFYFKQGFIQQQDDDADVFTFYKYV